jgi:hypothetical protein
LHHLDATLRAVLLAGLPEGTTVAFDVPGPAWRAGLDGTPTLNAYLVQLREDIRARTGDWAAVYDDRNRIVGRQAPLRSMRAHYVLTAWAHPVEDEHALLGAALRVLAAGNEVPAQFLAGALAEAGSPVRIDVAHPDLPAFPLDAWAALGTAPRVCLDVVLTVPVGPTIDSGLSRPPETVALDVEGTSSRPPAAPVKAPRPRRRVTERP